MKIRELAQYWEQNAKGRLSPTGHTLHLDVEASARLAALAEMYPKRTPEELLGELLVPPWKNWKPASRTSRASR